MYAKGGSNKMAPQMRTGTQVPGQSAQMGRGSAGFGAKGGSNKMAKQGAARPAKPGVSASN